jgi:hypothetical protein
MTSSASSPFKLTAVKVKETERLLSQRVGTHYARFLVTRAETVASPASWHDVLNILCAVELAPYSWLHDSDKIGSSIGIGSISARVHFDSTMLFDDEMLTFEDALIFACKEINPMLESFTTLFGIKHNIDITVEHGLRPTMQLLQNLVQPAPKPTQRVKKKGWFTL